MIKRLASVIVLVIAVASPLAATSQTVLGIIIEIITEGKKPGVVLQVLYDSTNVVPEHVTRTVNVNKRWPGCTVTLDGEAVKTDALQVGQLMYVHFNRQNPRMIACTTLPEGRLQQLRPAGQGFMVARCDRFYSYGDGRRPKQVGLELFLTCKGDEVTGVVAQPTNYYLTGCLIDKNQLQVKDGRVQGSLTLQIPGRGGKKALSPLAVQATVDLPVAGGDGAIEGTTNDKDFKASVTVDSYAPISLAKEVVTWITIGKGKSTHLAVIWQDGVPQLEHAYAVFAKGDITGKATAIEGKLADGVIALTATFEDLKGKVETYSLNGLVCGDRIGGTVETNGQTSPFIGGVLPIDCVWRGYLGHDHDEIPPRDKK